MAIAIIGYIGTGKVTLSEVFGEALGSGGGVIIEASDIEKTIPIVNPYEMLKELNQEHYFITFTSRKEVCKTGWYNPKMIGKPRNYLKQKNYTRPNKRSNKQSPFAWRRKKQKKYKL